MRKNLLVLILLIGLTACTSLIPDTDLPSTPAEARDVLEATAIETLTPAPQPTATGTGIPLTPTPSLTATFTPYPTPPGLLTHEELEQRMQDWISGEIEFNDAERQVDEFGNVLRLGVLFKESLVGDVFFMFYNLGFTLVKDQDGDLYLINIVGFEDGEGKRFTIVFSNGLLHDYEKIIHLSILQGRIIYQENLVSAEEYKPQEFAEVVKDLPNSVFGGDTSIGGVTGDDKWNCYLSPAKETTEALTDFLLCEECTLKDTPEILQPFINTIPEELTPDTPFLYHYYVSYW